MNLAQMAPSWVVLQLIEDCNLRCAMCYEWGDTGAYHDKRELSALELDVALRVIDECVPHRPRFELFGGEPLLYPGIWDVITRIRSAGCEVVFPTNGTLVEQHAERLVSTAPTRVWISLDGPAPVNDLQRGRGVFRRATRGLEALVAEKRKRNSALPEIGVTCVVTPANHRAIEQLFLEGIRLADLDTVSIELQTYATEAQHADYVTLLREQFGVTAAPYAHAYVRDPRMFATIDTADLVRQMRRVRDACVEHGVRFFSAPRTLEVDNIASYLSGEWHAMADHRQRCAVPWKHAEISARGDVTTCHTFYDAPLGNVNTQSLLEIWRGEAAGKLRAHLRGGLLPICTACCRYYQ